jgi:HAD superfamily hydrolase (TIGR01484 family)
VAELCIKELRRQDAPLFIFERAIKERSTKVIRAVVFDLDGTLLDENREISALNRQVIRDLRTQGIQVFLASGRTYMSMLPYYQSLDLDTPIISYNGAKIIYPDGEISESKLESQAVNTLVELSRSFQTHLNLYHDETW